MFAADVLGLLFPDDFLGAQSSLRYLLGALLASTLAGQLRYALMAMNRQVTDMRNTGASAVVHVAAKVALIPLFGIEGAAIGCLAGEVTLLVLSAATLARAFSDVRSGE